ncbi:Asp23/Gls24 family envelope stress response protein [Paenactinomyces guangxiensis]|uniref:Asp23/Gls24 family envelope stress response protein n=2 Tax=Paenactinomyces guangxiensis TaxID=1490290 RepID=A0A7W1WS02_9BACL|nr:Asp23/Gls24 family envelope stress response protein [Paenactinomyces guangxiensis]MBA4494994.1 Asp23/Gls24 family envelope stress response protein [Paenactinomyces guangxiensis]MBH8592077.1 Asp23/Gls24 family envelope stress response protein [Paenactinomyces guangxiensis]
MIDYKAEELGKVEIAPEVIQIISGLSASQVEGVVGLNGGLNQLLGRKNLRKGIRVDFDEQLTIELAINVLYGYHIPDVGREVQEKVKSAVESMTSLVVDRVIVRVEGIKFPQTEQAADPDAAHK